jgi:PAS domain S-box-containing protein
LDKPVRRLRWAILAAALVESAIGLAFIFTSNYESAPAYAAASNLIVAWSFVGCGFVALSGGNSRFGLLMSAVGITWLLGTLGESNHEIVYSVGQLVWGLPLALFIHALLVFPRGYLETRLVYATVGIAYGMLLIGPLALQLVGAGVTATEGPDSVLEVVESDVAAGVVAGLMVALGLFACSATIWVLVRRWRAASAPLRRVLAPVFATASTAIGVFLVAGGLSLLSEPAGNIFWWFLPLAVASVPIAFLMGLVRTRWARTAVAALVIELGEATGPRDMRNALRRALGDPSLRLVYWLPDGKRWVEVGGSEIDLEAESRGLATTLVEHEGETVAALLHDRSVDRELAGAVAAAASLFLARERSLQAVRESEGRYRALLEAIPDLMFRMSRDGTYLDLKGDPADLAAPPEDLIGAKAHDVLPRAVADKLVSGIGEALDSGNVVTGDYKLMLDGAERTFEARIVRDGDEAVLIVRDFTERDRLYGQLERERDFIRTVVDAAPSLFCLVDADGRIVRYNRTLEVAAGRPDTDSVRDQLFWDAFIAPEERDDVRAEFQELVLSPAPGEYENHWLTADGEHLLVAWTLTPLMDEEGRQRFLVSGIDVTDRRRQEEELRRSRVRLVQAGDDARRKLERNLHDGAQQRLVSLSLALRLAQARLKDDPDEADRLLAGAAEELGQALEELRELARGIHPAVLSERGLAAALEALAGRTNVPVDVTVPPDRLPPSVEAAAYYVISESLTNVAKYAGASAVEVCVTRQNGRAIVEVSDDGVGGADATRGSGLRGLVDRVEALDGVLRVESRPGAGTKIRAEIPCG